MIDINKIIVESIEDNLDDFVKTVPSKNGLESKTNTYKALMQYSSYLLEKYHESLKEELAKQNIVI